MQEAVQVAGARLRALVTVIGIVLVMLTGAAVMAKPAAAAAPAVGQVSVQDTTAAAPDTGRRCYRQTYWHHHHRYTSYKCRWYNDHHHYNNHHYNNHNNHHGNNHHGDNHHGGNRW
ncbi:hypothetical protein [Catellatospora tritici]|uniref:hypothetical protein n=1 Tax=Catellatospora tritici TaxID=2851566 RepID=UPI001C2D3FEA|nr:hypothetical protein [Catellatospora tritici]MBV1854750.1 hypothetical protein [Catellatospora tritici]